jgi:hypothetical protein
MTGLEEKLLGKSVIEKERDSESYRNRKLEKLVEKYKIQCHDAAQEITNLKAQLLGSSDIKVIYIYSQTCIKRSPLGQRKSGLI